MALRWDSTQEAHKLKNYKPKITIFELKQGYDSITGDSGVVKHFQDFLDFSADANKIKEFQDDMIKIFEQKRKLGLIPYLEGDKYKTIVAVDSEIEFVVILANYKSANEQLRHAVNQINGCKFIYANGMGYGLFSKNIINQNDFLERFDMR